jgi:hypothetical protein
MRLGREIPEIQFVVEKLSGKLSSLSLDDTLAVLIAIFTAGYFITDHIAWLIATGVLWWLNATFWDDASSWCWLLGLVLCLFQDTIKALDSPRARANIKATTSHSSIQQYEPFIRNFADLVVALTVTGMVDFSAIIVGLSGMVAAVITLRQLWRSQ